MQPQRSEGVNTFSYVLSADRSSSEICIFVMTASCILTPEQFAFVPYICPVLLFVRWKYVSNKHQLKQRYIE